MLWSYVECKSRPGDHQVSFRSMPGWCAQTFSIRVGILHQVSFPATSTSRARGVFACTVVIEFVFPCGRTVFRVIRTVPEDPGKLAGALASSSLRLSC